MLARSGCGTLCCTMPTRPAGRSRGVILAEELHLLGRELTATALSATVALDCHAARMWRDGAAMPKADSSVSVDLAAVAAWQTKLRRRATPSAVTRTPI